MNKRKSITRVVEFRYRDGNGTYRIPGKRYGDMLLYSVIMALRDVYNCYPSRTYQPFVVTMGGSRGKKWRIASDDDGDLLFVLSTDSEEEFSVCRKEFEEVFPGVKDMSEVRIYVAPKAKQLKRARK